MCCTQLPGARSIFHRASGAGTVQVGLSVTLWFNFFLSTAAIANDFTGEVIRVLDGDTIDVLPTGGLPTTGSEPPAAAQNNGKPQRIRLYGIDCPEKGQAFGDSAKDATSILSFALEVTLQSHGKDKYGRVLADVFLADGTNVNHELVKDGWCRWYQKYAPEDTTLEKLETEAREASRGMWINPDPVPPWEWRKRGKAMH